MITMFQMMTKNIFTLGFQNTIQFLVQIKLYMRKTSLVKKSKPIKTPESTSAIDVQTNPQSFTHCSHIISSYDPSIFKYKNYFQGSFLPDDFLLDLKTLQQQQSPDLFLGLYTLG